MPVQVTSLIVHRPVRSGSVSLIDQLDLAAIACWAAYCFVVVLEVVGARPSALGTYAQAHIPTTP